MLSFLFHIAFKVNINLSDYNSKSACDFLFISNSFHYVWREANESLNGLFPAVSESISISNNLQNSFLLHNKCIATFWQKTYIYFICTFSCNPFYYLVIHRNRHFVCFTPPLLFSVFHSNTYTRYSVHAILKIGN